MIQQTNDSFENQGPVIPAEQSLPEITLRVIILGAVLTIILAAANAFLGLKVGMTVSASIPAAVISMGILRFFRNSNVLENTMVQIMASVGEALTAGIAFITPALIILHVWDSFRYWETVAVSLIGGIFGVLFTIPIRRALLNDKTLRYPEGVAIGNVLRASVSKGKDDFKSLTVGGLVGGTIALFQSGFQILTDSFQYWVEGGGTIFGFGLGLSPALIAAGYIVGVNVSISIFVGILLGWIAGVPVLTWAYGIPQADTVTDMAITIWRSHIRYIGIGTMFLGSMWTLVTLVKPIFHSISASFEALAQAKLSGGKSTLRTEHDIPINIVFWASLILLIPTYLIISYTIIPADSGLSFGLKHFLAGFSSIYILIAGFVFCSVTAYFAGLIGSSNSPISGMQVSSLIILCLIFLAILGTNAAHDMVGIVIAIGSTVIMSAGFAISNDTMQDLKVGQIIGATPWKQQVMLVLGVVIASFVIPPILQLLYSAYGIGGAFPRPNMDPSQMLAAPQAGMMATVAKGIFSHQIEWSMLAVGAVIAVICIILDEVLKAQFGTRLPVLAVGIGIYLPLDATVPVVIGGLLTYLVQRKLNRTYHRGEVEAEVKVNLHRHRGLLLACGLVAGASLMGVILAVPFAIEQSTDALKLMPDHLHYLAGPLSILVTFFFCAWIYRFVMKKV
ncbi:MAG: oligopeptide transporter, OPT family [Gammaproteobacteria bacterium RIFCSPHIGHO2_12_FULL_38_14]|nr:MAG: oligopeptide transporter, OPT family [Gammaproteobacteria bacterium RIFCSPHIGHO2_12_FULL_38_14]